MPATTTERGAVIEWFKNSFSREAAATTKTSRLEDGRLSYRFSVTNTSDFDFSKFAFKVRVLDKETGMDIGSADINAGEWPRGTKKNFKSKLVIPPTVRNIAFVMYAESIDYDVVGFGNMPDAVKDIADAARDVSDAVDRVGEGVGSVLGELFGTGGMPSGTTTRTTTTQRNPDGSTTKTTTTTTRSNTSAGGAQQTRPAQPGPITSYTQRKNEKRLNKMRLGRSGWIVAGVVTGIFFLLAAMGSYTGSTDQIMYAGIGAASFLASLFGKISLGKKAKLIRTYETKVNKNGNTSLDDLSSYVGRPFEKVADDLHQMIADGFFPECYVDIDNRMLVMTKNGQPLEDVARSAAMNKKAKRKAARNEGVVPESLDDLITMTDDAELKAKLKSLRTVTKKIDARIEEVPDLEKQVKDFREKYYPEVVRLTDEYNEKIVDMGKYGEENVKPEVSESAEGAPVLNTNPNYLQEQAAEIKTQLISLIDSVTEASENLLEKLHEGDIMDITTDIKMLQTTLASKGLLDSDFDVKE